MLIIDYLNKTVYLENFKKFFYEFVLIWGLFFYYSFGFYYSNILVIQTKIVLFILALIYTLIYLPVSIYRGQSNYLFKGYTLFYLFLRFIKKIFSNINSLPIKVFKDFEDKKVFLFFLVKIIFIPIMLNFFIEYILYLYSIFSNNISLRTIFFNFNWFFILSALIYCIDTLFFSFGYIFESKRLRNIVISVDNSVLGWVAALSCYLPFNNITIRLFPMFADENIYFINDFLTAVLYVIVLTFYSIYLWATFALGTRCSNLTNRGIVKNGPYKLIRHPAYLAKIISWWILCVPILNLKVVISMLVWTFIYIIRAYTEEKHLMNDVDYLAYIKSVKFRFIPGIY